MILLTHPTGNTFSRALLRGLRDAGMLGLFATTIAVRPSGWIDAMPAGLRAELLRRNFEAPPGKLMTRPLREAVRLAAGRLGLAALHRHETGVVSFDAVYRDLDRTLAAKLPDLAERHGLRGVYAYEDGAEFLFQRAQELGLRRNYELPIAHWATARRLLGEEAARLPQWKPTLKAIVDSDAKLERKTRELEMAQVVVCPSQFVLDSIPAGVRATRQCVVSPFGSPPARANPRPARKAGQPMRVLFAGSMSQRKGLSDVFEAMRVLNRNDVELVVLGSLVAPMEFYRSEFPNFTYEPPRPHAQALELMATCDVLALPSIVEGRALVQQEAMAQGLALVATANAGGQDLIEDGQAGALVPIRSPGAIAEALARLADDRGLLERMQRNAARRAAALTWEQYARTIITAITGPDAPAKPGRASSEMATP